MENLRSATESSKSGLSNLNWPPKRVWVPAGKFVGDYGYWTFEGRDDPELVTVMEAGPEEVGVPLPPINPVTGL